jgi:hypothetical protein
VKKSGQRRIVNHSPLSDTQCHHCRLQLYTGSCWFLFSLKCCKRNPQSAGCVCSGGMLTDAVASLLSYVELKTESSSS